MNNIVATNVRALREHKTWTQEHLAQVADVTHRTIQRVESGDGASAETLLALASAFDLTPDVLKMDWLDFAKKQAEEQKKLEAEYRMVPVKRVVAPHDFDILSEFGATTFAVMSGGEEVRDVAAELEGYVIDLADILSDVGAPQRREYAKEAFEYVRRLEALGCVVSIGSDAPTLTFEGWKKPMKMTIGYLVVALEADEKPLIAVPRGRVQFKH